MIINQSYKHAGYSLGEYISWKDIPEGPLCFFYGGICSFRMGDDFLLFYTTDHDWPNNTVCTLESKHGLKDKFQSSGYVLTLTQT